MLGEITVNVGTQSWTVSADAARPARLPRTAAARRARRRAARWRSRGQDIPVVTRITGNALRACVRSLAPQVRIEPVDARFGLVKSVPLVVPDVWGRQLDVLAAPR